MTKSVDFVPTTIQEPDFTRTLDGKAVVMTPGVLKANTKAEAGSAPAGSQTTPAGGAARRKLSRPELRTWEFLGSCGCLV